MPLPWIQPKKKKSTSEKKTPKILLLKCTNQNENFIQQHSGDLYWYPWRNYAHTYGNQNIFEMEDFFSLVHMC